MELFADLSYYLYIEKEILSIVRQRSGIWKCLGEKYEEALVAEYQFQEEGTLKRAIGEFPVQALPLLVETLERYPFSSIVIIDEPNALDRIACSFHSYSYSWAGVSRLINQCCSRNKAVLICINGNEGNSLCCFSERM